MSAVVAEDRVDVGAISPTLNLVDEQNPWLGLDSFTEETRQYFHGREEEIAELARRVQRKTLAILFGQSGLGKTSILKAGIVPRLRREGYCPVYVRIDYARDTPAPSEQIKQAIFRATESAGKWTRPGTSIPGESLWEFLHHRDDYLKDAGGRTVIPLLIFDQFEEIFTLAQDDAFGRERAAEFVENLADLVENRPPKSLEVMLDSDEMLIERFDFERADYRILIALREDYLAHLEGFKGAMPSITQNRMRLARMTGSQALAAVAKPGGRLVTEEVAESIVRFVAGGSELRNAEVEPSLLSLVCRELNNVRVAQGRSEISADLLAGTRDTILHEFYERALEDQPVGVRRFIEDEMLTESGFRESLAEERVQRAFLGAGAEPTALAMLVNRRLLRIEERLDLRRVELTHDVLCDVVQDSRELRHEREAKEEAERQLEAQRAREAATHRALVRARQVAFGCAVLSIAAIAGAIFGYTSMKKAQEAEATALQTRTMAEGARGEAEKLIVYLLDDFYLELEPVGRLDIVGDLSRRAIAYYDALPQGLRTPETERNRALALVRYGFVLRRQVKREEAIKALDDAIAVLGRLRGAGDASETTAIGYSLALNARSRMSQGGELELKTSRPLADQSVEVMVPFASQPSASIPARRAYAYAMAGLGLVRTAMEGEEAGLKTLDVAREAFRNVDGLKLGDLASAAGFVEVSSTQMSALSNQRREEEARKVGGEAMQVATQILDKRPGHMGALRSRALLASGLSFVEMQDLHQRKAVAFGESAFSDFEALLKLDPGNATVWAELATRRTWVAWSLDRLGRPRDALACLRAALDIDRRAGKAKSDWLRVPMGWAAGEVAALQADLGNRRESDEALALSREHAKAALASLPKDSFHRDLRLLDRYLFIQPYAAGDIVVARDAARAFIARVEPLKAPTSSLSDQRNSHLSWAYQTLGMSLYDSKDFAGAEAALRASMKYADLLPWQSRIDYMNKYDVHVYLALALARQDRAREAREVIEPVLAYHRKLPPEAAEDLWRQLQLAQALYAASLASPAQAPELVAEASRIVEAFPQDQQRRTTVKRVRAWLAEAPPKRS